MLPSIIFIIAIICELLGFEISNGSWCCITILLVCDEWGRRFGKKEDNPKKNEADKDV